jgi:hypothetical protein
VDGVVDGGGAMSKHRDFADEPELCEAYWRYRQMSVVCEAELKAANERGDLLHVNHPLIRAWYRVQGVQRRADGRWPNPTTQQTLRIVWEGDANE